MSSMLVAQLDPTTLRAAIRGAVTFPQDEGWDAARQAWALAHDQRPLAVVQAADTADVAALTVAARAAGVRIAVQGAGHNPGPRGSMGDAVLLRMDAITHVTVDPAARRVRAGAGTLAGDVAAAASPHQLAALLGSTPDVSIAGYTLGGGLGWLARRHGLCSESLVSAEVVLPDGSVVRADRENNSEIFWALRGGGGNFGIVTEVELELFETPSIVGGMMFWPWERAHEVMHAWRAWCEVAPDTVTTSLRILQLPPLPELPPFLRGAQIVAIDGAILGGEEVANEVLAPLRALSPSMDMFGPVAPGDLVRIHGDPEEPTPAFNDGRVLSSLPDSAIDALVALGGAESGSPLTVLELRQLGGAVGRSSDGCGALGAIDGEYLMFLCGVPMTPELGEAILAREAEVMAATDALHAGHYLNFAEHRIDTAEAFTTAAHDRLCALRAEIDADCLLAPNHEISGNLAPVG